MSKQSYEGVFMYANQIIKRNRKTESLESLSVYKISILVGSAITLNKLLTFCFRN